jgi:hypothetical protein
MYLTGLGMTFIMLLMVTPGSHVGTPRIVVLERGAGLGLRRVRMRDRLVARIRRPALDRELAAGASPESSVALAVHARYLCRPEQRRLLARSLTEIGAASEAAAASRLRAPLALHALTRARGDLAAVIDRLVAAGPVDVRGVARIRNLLADGTGPLYREARPWQLREELLAALRAMDSFA